ncbi:hypothetical protein C9374_002970 [Naegleria lovaniensis]|uniref:Calponin-homology (CH) domain-containing protein n=1 Tax=Naegleria lovaniensis TaxID=51637 RepID=A0AA88GU27_NAELO|nr:uncharacterized protein C9374_002970 [Naegleria lovaniensis]KAG2385821.1 hypothetical protein C9374_002970 [Naegleria lovaniensis]
MQSSPTAVASSSSQQPHAVTAAISRRQSLRRQSIHLSSGNTSGLFAALKESANSVAPSYSQLQRKVIKEWLESETLSDTEKDLWELLKDGVVLVRLICLVKNLRAGDYMAQISLEPQGDASLIHNNISFFLEECKSLSNEIPTNWTPATLVNNLDIHAICHTIEKLSKFCEKSQTSGLDTFLKIPEIETKERRVQRTSSVIEELKQVSVSFVLNRILLELESSDPQYLATLATLLKMKDEHWCQEFVQKGGVKLISKVIEKLNHVYKTQKEKVVQGNYIYCLLILLEKEFYAPFLEYPSPITILTNILTKKESLVTRKYILDIFILLCNHSEEGFWIVFDAFVIECTRLAQLSTPNTNTRNSQSSLISDTGSSNNSLSMNPFSSLVTSFASQRDGQYRAKVLTLFTSLMTCPLDSFVRIRIRSLFSELDLDGVITSIENSDSIKTPLENILKEKIKEHREVMKREEQQSQAASALMIYSDPVLMLKLLYLDMGMKQNGGIGYLLEAMKRKGHHSGGSSSSRLSPSASSSASPTSVTSPRSVLSSPSSTGAEEAELKMLRNLARVQKQRIDKLKEQVRAAETMTQQKFVLTPQDANNISDRIILQDIKFQLTQSLKVLKDREKDLSSNVNIQQQQ